MSTFRHSYRAVVIAGLRSGRLSSALEGIIGTSRRMKDLRQSITIALIYPLVVVFVGYNFFLFAMQKLTPVTMAVYNDFVSQPRPALLWVQAMAEWINGLVVRSTFSRGLLDCDMVRVFTSSWLARFTLVVVVAGRWSDDTG